MKYVFFVIVLILASNIYASNINFPNNPCYLYNDETLKNIPETEKDNIINSANEIIKTELYIPQKEGQWIFHYNCPNDNTQLETIDEFHHKCTTCNKIYTDETTIMAYYTFKNNQLDNNILSLAKAYAITKDTKYLTPAKNALLELARLYPTFQRHDRWGRKDAFAVVGGRRYVQNLDEAYYSIILASAYDLLYSSLNDTDRKTISDMLKFIVKEILSLEMFSGAKNNWQSWFNASFAVVGLVTKDESLINESINGRFGLLWQLDNSVTGDGLWYEGAPVYQHYAMQAIIINLNAVSKIDWNYSNNEKLKKLWNSIINFSYPNGVIPNFHDSDPTDLNAWGDIFNFGYTYFNDNLFKEMADHNYKLNNKSTNMTYAGIAKLANDNLCLFMDYGLHGDSHGHLDKLNITLYALGKEILIDPGRISYSVPEWEGWCRKSIAHNTVSINGIQNPDNGKYLYFNDNAIYAMCNNVYPNTRIYRFITIKDNVIFDVFKVSSETKSTLDLATHVRGNLLTSGVNSENLYNKNGYEYLKDIKKINDSPIIFNEENGYLKIYNNDNPKTNIYSANGIGMSLNEIVPCIIKRTKANNAIFVTAYEISSNKLLGKLTTSKINNLPIEDAVNITFKSSDKKTYNLALDLREKPEDIKYKNKTITRILFY